MSEAVKTPSNTTVKKTTRKKKVAEVEKTSALSSLPQTEKETESVMPKTAKKTVTVCFNFPRSIKFEVTDNSGIVHEVVINGNATNLRGLPKGILPTAGAYGLTPNVDAELWDAIKKQYGQMPHFRNGLLFASDDKDVKDAVSDHKSVRNGFEPIDPKKTATKAKESE